MYNFHIKPYILQ